MKLSSPIPLILQWTLPLLMLLALPLSDKMALHPHHPSALQLFAYPFAHANLIHLALNAVVWLPMWRLVTWRRFICAYASAVGIGYIYMLIPSAQPLCGFSVIIFFFVGMVMPMTKAATQLFTISLVAFSFIIPHIAATAHFMAILAGLLYYLTYRLRPKD